jgi:hypothetical protein
MHRSPTQRPYIVTLVAKRLYERQHESTMGLAAWEGLGEAYTYRYVQQARMLVAFVGEAVDLPAFDRAFEHALEQLYARPAYLR